MPILIAGGSGFLGTALTRALVGAGQAVTILTRQNPAGFPSQSRVTYAQWDPNGRTGNWTSALNGAEAVVNLAGESIAAKRWSPLQKQKLRESRLSATRS